MNRRILSSLITLLYMSVAVLFSVLHEHHHETAHADGHDDDCAACQWQACATTDVPVCEIAPIVVQVVYRSLVIPASLPSESPFFSATASRAPPESLA